MIESKEEARRRGVKSPDRAEALMLAFAPEGELDVAAIYSLVPCADCGHKYRNPDGTRLCPWCSGENYRVRWPFGPLPDWLR